MSSLAAVPLILLFLKTNYLVRKENNKKSKINFKKILLITFSDVLNKLRPKI